MIDSSTSAIDESMIIPISFGDEIELIQPETTASSGVVQFKFSTSATNGILKALCEITSVAAY